MRAAVFLIVTLIIAGCGGGDGDARPASSLDDDDLFTLTVSGSVGDGPITGGHVVVANRDGVTRATQRSDQQANYRIQLTASSDEFPLIARVEFDKDEPADVARDFLSEQGAL